MLNVGWADQLVELVRRGPSELVWWCQGELNGFCSLLSTESVYVIDSDWHSNQMTALLH